MTETMRKPRISFFLNGRAAVAAVSPGDTALTVLRRQFGLTGTKEGCNEGDCGACTVALGELRGGTVEYRAFTSCLLPATRLHGRHVITVEGLGAPERPHPIQQAFLDHHATQCGFCTPGFVMSLFCLFARNPAATRAEIAEALEGNLCRCTGYLSIDGAGAALAEKIKINAGDIRGQILPAYCGEVAEQLHRFDRPIETVEVSEPSGERCLAYHLPATLEQAFDIMWGIAETADYRVVAGGTDVMVDANVKGAVPKHLVDVSRIAGLRSIRDDAGTIVIGANVPMTDILLHPAVRAKLPLLCAALSQMASLQVRNAATLAGNLATASPIGDAGTALLALDAVAVLTTKLGERKVPVESFYKGYRQTELCAHELVTAVEVPTADVAWDFQKSAKRSAVDITAVSSGFAAQVEGRRIVSARIALGGVAPTPVLARRTMELLTDKEIDAALIEQAARMAASEVEPISDVRGSREYRSALVRNHVAKHLSKLL
ncbi:MAG: FAD binding domain-containing protein [Candidatus Edwardsbacteria bacterium]|jgi:xanthine dehydrogenase small subunit|nr:FAD binding domain-containing protein [Candidatus Edwardsbacteria bacterium]